MNVTEALNWAYKKLAKTSSSPQLDAEVLLMHTLKKSREYLFANQLNNLTIKQLKKYKSLIGKRKKYFPVAYLTGHKEFYGLDFFVNKNVLIPRPESELLIDLAIDRIRNYELGIRKVFDLGTGSGCLIISLAVILERGNKISFYATDISKKALTVARKNAKAHKVSSKIKFKNYDLIQNCKPARPAGGLKIENSFIVANLPYLSTTQLNNSTIKHEPRQALKAGEDGLKYYKKLFQQLSKFKIQNSTFLFEHDPAQKKSLKNLCNKYLPKSKIKFHKDLSNKWRVLELKI